MKVEVVCTSPFSPPLCEAILVAANSSASFNNAPSLGDLAKTFLVALELANSVGIRSLCVSALGTEEGWISPMAAATVTMRTLGEETALLNNLTLVRFCIEDPTVYGIYLGAARSRNLIKGAVWSS